MSSSGDLWNLDLTKRLPRQLSKDGIEAVTGSASRIAEFLGREFPSFTEEGHLTEGQRATKVRYFESECDFIELRKDGLTIGALIGEPYDWGSYYVRAYAVSKLFQRPSVTRRFWREALMASLIEVGVKRVFADSSPVNIAMCRGLSEDGFFLTGNQLSERYGPMLRYTKFLCKQAESDFVARFAGTAPPRSTSQ